MQPNIIKRADYKNILIVLLGALGDVARGMSLVSPIKKNFPEARINWLVEPKSADLVKLHPQIDCVKVFRRDLGLTAFFETIHWLARQNFSITLDLQRHFKSGIFSLASRAPLRLSFPRSQSKEFNWLFNNREIPELPDNAPKIESYFLFLKELGVNFDPKQVDFGVSASCDPQLLSALLDWKIDDEPYLTICLGSTWATKDWPLGGWSALVKKLLDMKLGKIVLIGDKKQITTAEALLSAFGRNKELYSVVGKTDLKQLLTVIKYSRCLISPDSGPGHLAAMVRVPVVSLFGPTSIERTAPYGFEKFAIKAEIACAPCYRRICPGLDNLCMRLIAPEKVAQKVSEALSSFSKIVI
ncbi:MAG TPA: glycosyltransferase family 9 protein [Oligoflexia bacterium]|nr:glycosyltransferase family 9 protein [Oligoflexia bacterium]HMP27658.1 glycosyltransferase family 9 protein [Oligoflexia bacterium]